MRAALFLSRTLDWFCQSLAMLALFLLVTVTAFDVVGRTFFDAPLGFTFELAGVLLGIAVYAGLFGSNWRRAHVKIDLFTAAFTAAPRLERVRNAVSWLLEVMFFAVLAAVTLRQSGTVARWNERFYFLPVEKWVPMAAFFGFLCLALIPFILHLMRLRAGDEDSI